MALMTFSVENVAYRKESWTNNKRQYKRHVRSQWSRGQAGRAVDGVANASTCVVLDNQDVDRPMLMVDLGKRTKISGVRIVTRQGPESGERNFPPMVTAAAK